MMKIYTKTGDQGETGLVGGKRVSKDHLRLELYGTLDELNSAIGLVLASHGEGSEITESLKRVQNELFQLGSELATPREADLPLTPLGEEQVRALEADIDLAEKTLPKLKNFILPGGSIAGAQLHYSRTVCRRAERTLAPLHRAVPVRPEVWRYLNRLSDYLFVMARAVNSSNGHSETLWKSP